MKKTFPKNLLTIGLTLSLCAPVFANEAGLFVEPMLTYERGKADLDLPTPFNSSDSTVNGFGLGLRLGLHVYESVFVGIDGRYSRPKYKNDDTRVDRLANSYNFGPIVGIQMPTPIAARVWGSYIMGGEMDVAQDGDVDYKFKKGEGYRIGGGIKLAAVSLNLEYQDIKYDETELSDASIFSGTTSNAQQTNQSVIFSVSFPISI